MSLSSSPCPSARDLQDLLAGSLPAARQAEAIVHLDDCGLCQRKLEELAGADPALLAAAEALRRTACANEAPLRRVLDHLKTDAGLSVLQRADDRAALVQSLLRPADAAAALGSLDGYEVVEVLGQGGMGVVLKAFDPALKRYVALKVLAPDLARDAVARRRFAREAQAAAAVRHEHVVVIHGVSETNGVPYLVMEYVAGGSLQDYLDLHGPPDGREAARIGAEIASGLAAAHAEGLIHRDVKPSNILLDTEGQSERLGSVKIADFGLARLADEVRLTQSGTLTGTPMYMAPEQARGEALDSRADLFSLGSVLYTLCTGREPFPADGPMVVLRHVCETTPPPIRDLNPAIPAWLAATVEHLHAKDPADRFASAAEVAELLRYNLEHPDQPRFPTPLPRKRRRLRVRLVAAAVVAGLLLGSAWAAIASILREQPGSAGAPAEMQDSPVRLRATLTGHTGPIWSVAYAPDGRTLATASDDTTLRFWDNETGRETAQVTVHDSSALAVSFAHSGKFLVSCWGDGVLRLWDPATRQEQGRIELHGTARRAPLAPDDRTVAVASSTQGVELWDLQSRTRRRTLAGGHGTIVPLAFAPDGRTLAAGDTGGLIRLWDPDSGAEQAHFRGDPLGLRALAFAPDGRTLASVGSEEREVKLWDVARREVSATLSGFDNDPWSLAFSPDGRTLACGTSGGTVRIWDVASTRLLARLADLRGRVWSLAFSPDGRTLATVGEDRVGRLWDASGLEGPGDQP
jgi:serine/threonine protein kinase